MSNDRHFYFNGSVTYIENYYEDHENHHKDSEDSSEMKNDTDEVVFEQSVKVKCASSSAGRSAENLFSTPEGEKDVGLTGKMADAFVIIKSFFRFPFFSKKGTKSPVKQNLNPPARFRGPQRPACRWFGQRRRNRRWSQMSACPQCGSIDTSGVRHPIH